MSRLFIKNLIILFFVLSGCSTVPVTGRKQLNLVSDQEVLTLSLQQYDDFIKKAKLSQNRVDTERVERVGSTLVKAVELYLTKNGTASSGSTRGYAWEFRLIEEKQVNAFCMPGGKIVVYEGILPLTTTDSDLAVVLSHEIAHAVAKHSNERMSQQMAAQVGGTLLTAVLAQKGAATQQVALAVYGLGAQVGVMLPYSRKHEYEADRLGLIFMAMSGYDMEAAPRFWENMSKSNNKGAGSLEILSTHPSDDKRIENLRNSVPEALSYKIK